MKFKEFVSRVKSKYPEYQDIEDNDLGFRILTKYPEYIEEVDSNTIPSPYQANEILNRGIAHNADEVQRNLMNAALNPLDQEAYKAKLYYDQKFGFDHTPTMLEQQIELEYGRNANLQGVNEQNKRWALYQFEQKNKAQQAAEIFYQGLKVAGKSVPEYLTVNLAQMGMAQTYGMAPAMYANPNFEKYQKDITVAMDQIDNIPSFKALRKSAQKDAELRDEYINKFRNPKAQSLATSWKEGNFEQLGADLFDLAALELPNFLTIMSTSLINPALGLAYVGTTSGANRYAEGIANGESPEEAAGKANAHAAAEIVFEKLGTVGLIQRTVRRTAQKEFTRGFVQKAVDLVSEPTTEVATQITQNLVDGKDWNEGVVEAGAIGAIYGAGVNTAITLGDATRTRFQNTNKQIDEIVEADPILSETPERAELARTALKNPTESNLVALNNDIFKEEQIEVAKYKVGDTVLIDGVQGQVTDSIFVNGKQSILVDDKPVDINAVELAPVAEPTKTIEQAREEAGVIEDNFADVKDALLEETTPEAENVNKTRSRLVNDVATPLLSLVEDIAPSVGTRLRRYEFDVRERKVEDLTSVDNFLSEMKELAKTDSFKFTQVSDLLQNGQYQKAAEFLSNESIQNVRSLIDKYADELEAVGFDVSRQTDYFPRRVKDYEGLKAELGSEISGQIDKALAEQQKKAVSKGYVLSPIEEAKIINNVITGAYRPIDGVKPKALKQRKIDQITSDISPYYYDAQESLMMYLNEVAEIVETRKLFGKDLKLDGDVIDINESVGAYINEIAKDLEPQDQSKLISLFRTRFGYRPTGKLASKYKSIVAMTTLGQVQNAITQIGDVTWSIYENGFASTIDAAFGKKGITTKDLNIEEIAEEYKDPDGFNKVVDTIFKTTGFKKIDRLGKETLVNAALTEYQMQAEAGKFTRDKQDRLNILFPDQAQRQQVIEDLKNKQQTKDVKFLLFSTLLDWQPISLSNMPPAYLKMPNGRILYTLKTFTIKQLDIFRQRGIDNIVEGIATKNLSLVSAGFGEILRIAGLFYLMNVPIDLIKDWITGKDIDFSDTMIDNFYKLIGVSRYNIEYATRGGRKPSEVLVRTVVPPFSFMDIPFGDLVSMVNNLKKGEETDLLKLESWRFLPFAGQTLYYTVGKGKEKEEKKRKEKEKEN